MKPVLATLREERGSALLISIVLAFVMTLLGLALFDLGAIENRLVLANQADVLAFEAGQAGLERAMDALKTTLGVEETAGAAVPNGPSWADGSTSGGTTTQLCASGACTSASFDTANSAYINNTNFGGGSYAISFKLLTVAETNAAPYSTTCLQDKASILSPPILCADLILVRSTGTVNGPPPGYTATRTLQALVRGSSTSPFGGGVTAGSSAGAILGNVKIAGTINIIGNLSGSAALTMGGTSGQRNNWEGLSNEVLDRLTPLQLICPPGTTCGGPGDLRESLGATLKIAKPLDARAVDINSGSVDLGTAGSSGNYGRGTADNPVRRGKGPLDGMFIADGCVMPCTQNGAYVPNDPASKGSFTGRTDQVHVDGDNITKPFPVNPPPPFPLLTDRATIGGVSYTRYACPAGSSCAGQADFFLSHAARLDNVAISWIGACPGCPATFGALFSGPGLTGGTQSFTNTLTFTDGTGAVLPGQMCWTQATKTLTFGSPICAFPTQSKKDTTVIPNIIGPLLVYFDSPFRVISGGPILYQGAAVILTTGLVEIQTELMTAPFPPACGPVVACLRKFPKHDMLGLMTANNMIIGETSQLQPAMGLFYVGPVGGSLPANPEFRSAKQTQTVGTVTGWKFNFTGQVPEYYQVSADPRDLPEEFQFQRSARWSVSFVPGFWKLCRPGATPTSPPTPTGICGYN